MLTTLINFLSALSHVIWLVASIAFGSIVILGAITLFVILLTTFIKS